MTASAPARPGWWPVVCRAFAALGHIHVEQACMWGVQAVANRAAVPHEDPLTWILTMDGYRLHGTYLPVGSGHQMNPGSAGRVDDGRGVS